MQDSESNEDTAQRLCTVSNCNIQQANFYLEACQGDFNSAIQMYYSQEELGSGQLLQNPVENMSDRPSTSQGGFAQYQYQYEQVEQPIQTNLNSSQINNTSSGHNSSPGGLLHFLRQNMLKVFGGMGHVVVDVISYSLNSLFQIVKIALDVIGGIGQFVIPRPLLTVIKGFFHKLIFGSQSMSPQEEASQFINEFQQKWNHHIDQTNNNNSQVPTFLETSFQEAFQISKNSYKFLFVYLHSPMHQDTDQFCKNTLCSQEVSSFISQEFTCWGGNVQYSDAYKVSQLLQVVAYPYCSLIVSQGSRRTQLCSIVGNISSQQMVDTLQRAQNSHQMNLEQQRINEEERVSTRSIREMQEQAYQESLKRDQLKLQQQEDERQKKLQQELLQQQQIEAQRKKDQEKQQKLQMKQQELQDRKHSKKYILKQILNQPNKQFDVNIRLRMPNGENHQQKFNQNDKVQLLYDYADSLESNNYCQYRLCTNYPKTELSYEMYNQTLKQMQLTPQALLFLQPLDDDSDTDQ